MATLDASLTHDEAVYVDIAQDPLNSTYYPDETFLRQPPGGIGLITLWDTLDVPLNAFPLPWVLGGITLLALAIRERSASPWLLVPTVALPVLAPLISVTMYPPLFAFLALAAWGWASEKRSAEIVGWNLAVLMHGLALLLLALVLLPRAFALFKKRVLHPWPWLRELVPYPAAIAWGSVMVWGMLAGTDPRGGTIAQASDPTANAHAVILLKPLISIVFALLLIPLLRWPRIRNETDKDWGTTIAASAAIFAAPFYRYMVALVPLLVVARAVNPTALLKPKRAGTLLVTATLLTSGVSGWMMSTGADPVNAADLPGLVDHDEATRLLEPGDNVVIRSPPSMAHALREEGWRVTQTGTNGPSVLHLENGDQTLVLYRAETLPGLHTLNDPEAALVPTGWSDWINDLESKGWTPTHQAGGLVRLNAP